MTTPSRGGARVQSHIQFFHRVSRRIGACPCKVTKRLAWPSWAMGALGFCDNSLLPGRELRSCDSVRGHKETRYVRCSPHCLFFGSKKYQSAWPGVDRAIRHGPSAHQGQRDRRRRNAPTSRLSRRCHSCYSSSQGLAAIETWRARRRWTYRIHHGHANLQPRRSMTRGTLPDRRGRVHAKDLFQPHTHAGTVRPVRWTSSLRGSRTSVAHECRGVVWSRHTR